MYDCAKDTRQTAVLEMGQCGQQTVGFFHCHRDHVDWVFVDHASYHRAGEPTPAAAWRVRGLGTDRRDHGSGLLALGLWGCA